MKRKEVCSGAIGKDVATFDLTWVVLLGGKPINVLSQHTKTSNHESDESRLVMKWHNILVFS